MQTLPRSLRFLPATAFALVLALLAPCALAPVNRHRRRPCV